MISAGDISKTRNLFSGLHRRKKQFRRGAKRSIANRQDPHATKQMTAACAAIGNWRKMSIPSIGTPSLSRAQGMFSHHDREI
jgi:hypothetical protein